MSSFALTGVLGPVTTPFTASETPDLVGFASNIRSHLAHGLHGIVVCGSTGEAALLDESERTSLIETARAAVPADRLLLMGTGAESTKQCVTRCRDAGARGANGVLVVAPHYYGPQMTAAALRAHYQRVADESPVPVVLYNIPKYMHFKLEPELVAELSMHENIVGIKDSSGDLALLEGYLQAQGSSFTVLTGNGGQLLPGLELGVRGGIVAVGLFGASLCVDVYDGFRNGDIKRATIAQDRLKPMASQIVAGLGEPGVKAAMEAVGLVGGPVRLPLQPLNAEQRKVVQDLMVA
ncbi:MAG: dihydrodipicolinate synthase family protein [Gemmatimonadaceae bacterium]|nr:dihydrodipicolinate synthase family protein [Gemmatimonadaceae bacterium]